MLKEIPGWCELTGGELQIWEGVCALYSDTSCKLFKIRNNQLFSLNIQHNFNKVSSDGYWNCAEITGEVGQFRFYYHCTDPESGVKMLNLIQIEVTYKLMHLNIRLDDDPLRYGNVEDINIRLSQWSSLLPLAIKSRLIIDRNMPL